MLIGHKKFWNTVKWKSLAMVGRDDWFKELICDCKNRKMLNIWIAVYWICNNMMSVMASFPPANAYTSEYIANKKPNLFICIIIMSDKMMTSIVSNKCYLLKEKSHNDCSKKQGCQWRRCCQQVYNQPKKKEMKNKVSCVESICKGKIFEKN